MKITCFATAAILVFFVTSSTALPRFALRGGEAWCGGCHINPTGGGMRTSGGDHFAMNKLPMWKNASEFSADIGKGLRIGTDMRSQYLYFSDKTSGTLTTTDSLGKHTTTADNKRSLNGALSMSMPVYISATITPAFQAYVRFDPLTAGAWEGYGLIHFVHPSGEIWKSNDVISDAYIKIGAFLPTFGVRFDDHTVYTRGGSYTLSGYSPAGLFWQPNYKDEGFELGFALFDRALITADFLNGNELDPAQQFKQDPMGPHAVSLRAVVAIPIVERELSLEVGGSAYIHTYTHLADQHSPTGFIDTSATTSLYAVHGGVHAGPVSILAEADFGSFVYRPLTGEFRYRANAMAIETSVDITDGLTGLVRFDNYSDYNSSAEFDQALTDTKVKSRFMIGAQWFPLRFLEVRPEVRFAKVNAEAPQDPTQRLDHLETTALLQTHIFF